MQLCRFFSVIVIILLTIFKCESKKRYVVGLLIHDDSHDTEMAFDAALSRFNSFNIHIEFESTKRVVSKDDVYSVYNEACDLISSTENLVGIFGPTSPAVAPIVTSICNNLEIPNVQIHWSSSQPQETTSINVHPDAKLFSIGLATVVKNLNWNSFAILFQDYESLIRLQYVMALQKDLKERILIRQIELNADNRALIKDLKNRGYVHFIIDCDLEHVIPLLKDVKEVEMLDYFHSYFITSLDAHTIDYTKIDSNSNITTVRLFDPEDEPVQNTIRDWEVSEMYHNRKLAFGPHEVKIEPALMHDAVNFFVERFYQLYLTQRPVMQSMSCENMIKWDAGYRVASYLKITSMENGVTGKIMFKNNTRSTLYLQVVEIIHGNTKPVAEWSSFDVDELNLLRSESDMHQQMSTFLQNTTFIVSSRIGRPYLMYREPQYPGEVLEGNSKFEGFSLDIIDEIAKKMNISYKFVLAADKLYGNYNPVTKSWNGLIKDLLDRRAHLAICDLTITHQRRSAVDFSLPFMTLGVSILYSKSKPTDRDIFAFMNPFDSIVWMYIVTAYISFTLILYFIARMAPGDWENPNPNDLNPEELENIWDLKNCFWFSLGSTMSQGCDLLPKGISSRMASSMWWFFILIISSSYTANLAAFLTMVQMGPSIDNAEALSKQTKIKYGTVEGGATQAFFRESNFSTYQRMWMQMFQAKPSVFEKSNDDGVKRVKTTKNGLYAFLMESSSIEYVVERDCELKQVGGRLDSKGYGIAMPMNSPYRHDINTAVLKLQEEGVLSRLKTKWWKEMHGGGACDDVDSGASSSNELGLANTGGVFLVLGIGVAIAFLISLMEFFWNIRTTALEEHKGLGEVFLVELRFAVSFWIVKKRVNVFSSKTSTLNVSSNENGNNENGNSEDTLADVSGIVKVD
nr:glutamate receptor ionotropic, kainate 2-like [Onthophagus taurus]